MVANHPPRRKLVVVSGAPGAGKTTLAVPLARRLGLPLFSKDFIKEALVDALGSGDGDLAVSRRLGGATMEVMWSLAAHAPGALLEANFRPRSAYEKTRLLALDADVVEVHCSCGMDEARRRFEHRAARPGQHAAHPLRSLSSEALAEYDGPMGVGTVLSVDTRNPVDVEVIAARVSEAWNTASS